MNAVAAAEQRAVNIEEIRLVRIPAEASALEDARLDLRGCHSLDSPCIQDKAGRANGLSRDLLYLKYRTLAAAWTLEAAANLRRIDLQFGDGATEGVAVHAEFLGGFALVSPVMGEDFDEVALFEFAHRFFVGNPSAVHLRHEVVKFTSHCISSFLSAGLSRFDCCGNKSS